jgi:ATP-dependent DNA ligase
MLVGFYEGKKLTFAGRVGTGFNEKLLSSLSAEMNKLRINTVTLVRPNSTTNF